MGGRGGGSPTVNTGGDQASREFEFWANSDIPIGADYVGEGRLRLTLPDTGAYVIRQRQKYTVYRDSDDKVLFTNSHDIKGLWTEISRYYGGRIEVTVDRAAGARGTAGVFGKEYGRKTSPAARRYGVK